MCRPQPGQAIVSVMTRILLAFLLVTLPVHAADLGSVAFPTSSTNAEAQAAFERGVAALHSFWYEEAAAATTAALMVGPLAGAGDVPIQVTFTRAGFTAVSRPAANRCRDT